MVTYDLTGAQPLGCLDWRQRRTSPGAREFWQTTGVLLCTPLPGTSCCLRISAAIASHIIQMRALATCGCFLLMLGIDAISLTGQMKNSSDRMRPDSCMYEAFPSASMVASDFCAGNWVVGQVPPPTFPPFGECW